MSDLHLELNRQYATFDFPVKAPLLVLGGGIGRLVDYEPFLGFLARQTARFDKAFLVLGNHGFYEMSYDAGAGAGAGEGRSPGRKAGCTLWSNIPPAAEDAVTLRVSDYKMIQGWTVAQHNACRARV
ncbi:hypothetical protein QQX98_001053 [Neonectria punicea]|uniref:Calcineurin-like phosphoesterase domain-containing protein n=1 Tax=Neonectria punicea TaxID=979145 RepID=A0ABR1HQU1_9HYPO